MYNSYLFADQLPHISITKFSIQLLRRGLSSLEMFSLLCPMNMQYGASALSRFTNIPIFQFLHWKKWPTHMGYLKVLGSRWRDTPIKVLLMKDMARISFKLRRLVLKLFTAHLFQPGCADYWTGIGRTLDKTRMLVFQRSRSQALLMFMNFSC